MPRRPTEETHFFLAYGMKVVISTEVEMPTFQTTQEPAGKQEIEAILDQADESKEATLIQMEAYHHQVMAYYNK